jgi:Rha family phage regulatory protein
MDTIIPDVLTMSSREIAELTGKEHRNVMRDIRAMLVELHGEANLLKFEQIEKDARNRDQPVFLLPKRETLVLISGYSIPLRAKVIDRLAELEAAAAPPPPPRRHALLPLVAEGLREAAGHALAVEAAAALFREKMDRTAGLMDEAVDALVAFVRAQNELKDNISSSD